MASIIDEFSAWLQRPARAGQSAHELFFAAACFLCERTSDDALILRILRAGAARVKDRIIPERELREAIRCARHRNSQPGNTNTGQAASRAQIHWPPFDPALHSTVCAQANLLSLRSCSGLIPPDSETCLEILFPGDPLLCYGVNAAVFHTQTRSAWKGSSGQYQFVVPSAMSAPTGITKDGRVSAHCEDNTGIRQHIIVEFDSGTLDQHAACLIYLSRFLPLRMAVFSGSKSLHGWFDCRHLHESQTREFFSRAVMLGADSRLWSRSQFVRMPFGKHANGNLQPVLYFKL